jgi:hypothetical protein
VVEGLERVPEAVLVLGAHVLAHQRQAPLAQGVLLLRRHAGA